MTMLSMVGHKISKESGSKVQLQLVHHDGSTTVFHFVGADPKSDRSQVSERLLQMISKVSQQVMSVIDCPNVVCNL